MFKRLRDWWTRPSWEEYLAEHSECVRQQERVEHWKAQATHFRDKYQEQAPLIVHYEDANFFLRRECSVLKAHLAALIKVSEDAWEALSMYYTIPPEERKAIDAARAFLRNDSPE